MVAISGGPKTGKSHLGLTFPDPIVAIEVGETGIGDLLEKFRVQGKDITYKPLRIKALEPTVNHQRQLLNEFADVYLKAINDEKVQTIIIDSNSRLRSHIQAVKLDEVRSKRKEGAQGSQMDYGPANEYEEQVVNVAAVNPNLNLVLVHRHKDVYVRDDRGQWVPSGEYEARDYKGMENLVQVMVWTDYKDRLVPGSSPPRRQKKFVHTIQACRFRPELAGWEEEEMDYNKLVELIYG